MVQKIAGAHGVHNHQAQSIAVLERDALLLSLDNIVQLLLTDNVTRIVLRVKYCHLFSIANV